jgi:ABC-2 type transport system ATP-binding protein
MKKDIVQVINLSKFFNSYQAVKNVSFTVSQGEIFAFLGPNGAGKTTIIKMLTTLLTPSSGLIIIGGLDALKEKNAVRRLFGIVFQDPSLDFDLTPYENMQFHAVLYGIPRTERKKRIEELLRLVGLWERRNSLVKTFSGGMRRRLEVARGILHQPKILFLDEPTLGLDPQARNLIWQYLFDLNQKMGVTIFFTTHYLDEAEAAAGQVAIIDNGEIIALGTPAQLRKKTKTKSLEEAYLRLVGKRTEEEAGRAELMRQERKLWVKNQ